MTRINCVPPEELHDKFLVAEYHELPRVYNLVKKAIARGQTPEDFAVFNEYTMGSGHVKFFYTRLKWLAERQASLVEEMLRRKMRPNYVKFEELFDGIRRAWFGDWVPDEKALAVNRARLNERLEEMKNKPKRKVVGYYEMLEMEKQSEGKGNGAEK
jgi:hypothetical protein